MTPIEAASMVIAELRRLFLTGIGIISTAVVVSLGLYLDASVMATITYGIWAWLGRHYRRYPVILVLALSFVGVGCTASPSACTAPYDRVATEAEWAQAAKLVGIHGKRCPEARIALVDDVQASLYGMGERSDDRWWSGDTFTCGADNPTVTLLRLDGEAMHPGLLTHELVHAAISCATDGEDWDEDHSSPVWQQLEVRD
jgi:hypothetical protein